MQSSTVLRLTDQLLAKRISNLRLTTSKLNYSSELAKDDQTESSPSTEFEYIFEAPEIFKAGGHENIVRLREPQAFGEKLEKNTLETLPLNADWPSLWPTAATFDPNRVPLPLHQGAHKSGRKWRVRMSRWQNSELIKIPNFLHLTPEAIKRQTDAIRKFCTKFPSELKDEKTLNEHFPITIYSQDRVHSSPSIRDPAARVIQLQIHIDKLKLDEHAKDKLIRLLRHRYDAKTGIITIESNECPFKDQNLELSIYRLTASYFESWNTEDWGSKKDVTISANE